MLLDGKRENILIQMKASPGACLSVCSLWCCGLSRKGLRVVLITRPEESYLVWYAWI